MSVYIYGRVSHEDSGLSGISETGQLQTSRNYIKSVLPDVPMGKSHHPEKNVDGYYFDRAKSAWRVPFNSRPASYALDQVLKPGDHVVMYSIDRGFRSVKAFVTQIEIWLERGITPHFVTEGINFATAEGKLMGHVIAAFAQYYSDLISERTREALRIRKLIGANTSRDDKGEWLDSDIKFIKPARTAGQANIPGRIIPYARCSHIDSQLSGLGMEAQIGGNKSYSNRLAQDRPWLTPIDIELHDNSVSAFSVPLERRPAGKRLLEMVQPGDVIVAYRLDRIFRTPHDAAKISSELAKRNIAIHIVQSGIDTLSDYGQMLLTMLSVFAYIESSIKSKRNLEAAARCRELGRPYGTTQRHITITVDKKTRDRRLAYDLEKMTWMCAAWLCRNALGYNAVGTSDIMHALYCYEHGEQPMIFGWRKRWGQDQITRYTAHWAKIKDTIPPTAVNECIEQAIKLLETELPDAMRKHIKCQYPLPDIRQRIEGHLVSA